ncbi:helix-turn-helix domain-containing protein [Chryseobacterium sp. Ch-15]|uniref:AraC family transcriptional regulator n=1 Tax=Chryseobacterium muglaense TaxID=2893752 RepID=A0A9Q3YSH4_9FLAO|nr:helix-turn-helix domain-containing protein [Chryseobacterium muglaense]MBD3903205.1 AraC family transcriptional regulator [Chryseobacterium muglaense]MCC9036036.1 helix-turn-helix domain-containing protein [Chryseobacterium muglaense]MCM2553388.1 helix-turn-helix domain-containing protein [Chryseobacterium muglaense]
MIYTTLLNIAIFEGIILGLVILKSSLFNSNSNKYLAYLLFALSFVLLNYVFEIEGTFTSYPFLRFIDDIEWVFLLPVFMFLFIINRIDDAVKDRQKYYLYYIPFAYSSIVSITYDLSNVAGLYEIPDSCIFLVNILRLIQLLFAVILIPFLPLYSYFMIRYLKDSQEKKWVITLLTIIYLLLFVWLTTYMTGVFFGSDISSTMSVLALCATFVMHWTAYIGIYKYKLAKNKVAIYNFLNNEPAVSLTNLEIVSNAPQEYKESITADNLYFEKLELLCKDQHIYTDSTLNREKVAEKLGISAGYVSQIVNTITGDNFAHYINHYRVEAVKEMISNPEYENYNLLTMGLEAGFTSKTTFYNSFKKVTGQTPNEYKNAIK